MENNQFVSDNLEYFNLFADGNTATVRLLHKSVSSVEHAMVHNVLVNGKKNVIKCLGDNCPICVNNQPFERVYIKLFDYADNKVKVWVRTDRILSKFQEIENNWGDLSQQVLKITRIGNDFPKYDVQMLNPANFVNPNIEVDKAIAYRFYKTRSAEELNEFLRTGVMPAHKKQETPSTQAPTPKASNNFTNPTQVNSFAQNTGAQAFQFNQPINNTPKPQEVPWAENFTQTSVPIQQQNVTQSNNVFNSQTNIPQFATQPMTNTQDVFQQAQNQFFPFDKIRKV